MNPSNGNPESPLWHSGVKKSYPQNSEEAERLFAYQVWPKVPPKVRRALLLKVAATTGEELETWLDSLSHPSTATNGDQ